MNKKSLIIKFLVIVAVISSAFVLSSCFTSTIGIISCKRSCQESCKSSTEDNMSGHEYGVYYELSADGESYLVSEVGYSETSVIIPESYEGKPVTGIKRGAFSHDVYGSGCSGTWSTGMHLSSLTLPSTIKTIEEGVFTDGSDYYYHAGGGSCDTLIFKGTLEDWFNIDFNSTPFFNATEFYINGAKVTDLVIPEAVTKINKYAFAYYGGLKSVTLHENITEIGEYAFLYCDGLKSVTFPCKDLTIDDEAFAACMGLEKVAFTGENVVLGYENFEDCVALKEVEWNTVNITVIPDHAFRGCESLRSFVIPSSVTRIGFDAFWGCYNLVEVYNLSKLNVVAGSTNHGGVAQYAGIVHTAEEDNSTIMTVGDYKFVVSEEKTTLFKYTGEGGALNLPVLDGGKTYDVRSETFYANGAILSVNIPDCVTEIGARAFENCDNLKIISGCTGLVKIGERAFADCRMLESVALVKVETIGYGAFANSRPLKALTLPATVKEIGRGAFNGCTAEISFSGSLEDWGKVILAEDGITATVTCSDGVWEGKI